MSGRPIIRTYGKARPLASSSTSSMIFESSSPPTSPLLTPHPSSDNLDISSINSDSGIGIPAPKSEKIEKSEKTESKENILPKAGVQQSTLRSFFTIPPKSKKRPLDLVSDNEPSSISSSRPKQGSKADVSLAAASKSDKVKESLTQLHLTHLPLLHTCQSCQMSYVRGGEDEGLHERHHARVTRGVIWDGLGRGSRSATGRGKGKEERDLGWRVINDNVGFGTKGKGKIIMAEGSYGGTKLDDILKTVDTVLSSPPLPPPILNQCKIFLFVTASAAPSKRLRPGLNERTPKERVIGVVVAQGIKWAMRVMTPDEQSSVSVSGSGSDGIRVVDSGDGVMCDPKRLDTPLGIHRVFTIPTYRSLGIAQLLLDAACRYTVYGCSFDPLKGQVAFSQPTNSGRGVMTKWGQGQVRVFVDDESQL